MVHSASLTFVTAEIVRDLWLRGHTALSQFQVLKLWIDEYVNLWSMRQSLSSKGTGLSFTVGHDHQTGVIDYAPLSIGVPQVALYDGNLATATQANQHAARRPSHFDANDFHAPLAPSLAAPFDVDTMITPRQNLSMSELIDPKPEPSTT